MILSVLIHVIFCWYHRQFSCLFHFQFLVPLLRVFFFSFLLIRTAECYGNCHLHLILNRNLIFCCRNFWIVLFGQLYLKKPSLSIVVFTVTRPKRIKDNSVDNVQKLLEVHKKDRSPSVGSLRFPKLQIFVEMFCGNLESPVWVKLFAIIV